MGFGSHSLAIAHIFACENSLGAFLVRVVKLGFFDISGEYLMLLGDFAGKATVLDLELGHGLIVILALCVIFLFSASTRSRSV